MGKIVIQTAEPESKEAKLVNSVDNVLNKVKDKG